ncbi:DUF397 domain-containing protein [Streptomyces sp. NPDC091387]|uniref:DUF397 domain-containing protein n=1 Tax=unclassified Streptomyces TaxID=2593676 RepID=UPI00366941ED
MSDKRRWFKSSYSNSEGGDCVEAALSWRTSTYSDSEGGSCVQVAPCPTAIHVRDSKLSTGGPELTIPAGPWAAFVAFAVA